MIPPSDGTFRFSPRDLVAYLEGDFSAWCERAQPERARAGGAGSPELEGRVRAVLMGVGCQGAFVELAKLRVK